MFPLQDTIPRRESPFVTWLIVAINVFVFFIELSLSSTMLETFIREFGLVPARYMRPDWLQRPISYWPFLTNMFVHGGWLHLIGNMWTLWIFGDNVEDRLGHVRYAIFYVLCGITASLTHVVLNPGSAVPTIGASGAIAGVMGAYFFLFPYSRIIALVPLFFFPWFVEVPAILYLGFWFMTQLFSGSFALMAPEAGGGIAWWAHIGGFVMGLILVSTLRRSPRKYRAYYADEWIPVRHIIRT